MSPKRQSEPTVAGALLDLAVHAPIGLAFGGPARLEEMVETGRQRISSARVIGEAVIGVAPGQLAQLAARAQSHVAQVLRAVVGDDASGPQDKPTDDGPGPEPSPSAPDAAAAAKKSSPKRTNPRAKKSGAKRAAKSRPAKKRAGKAAAQKKGRRPGQATELGIPSYDSLAARQVVTLLEGLSTQQRAAVEAYERAGRRRVTILNRIAQLQNH